MKATFYLNRNGRMKQRRTLSERFHEMNHNKDTSGSVLGKFPRSVTEYYLYDLQINKFRCCCVANVYAVYEIKTLLELTPS